MTKHSLELKYRFRLENKIAITTQLNNLGEVLVQRQYQNNTMSSSSAGVTSYERYRAEWLVDDVHVVLDEYPYAMFIELEGGKATIERLATKLGFNTDRVLTKPVDTLFQEWRKYRGFQPKEHMHFGDYDK